MIIGAGVPSLFTAPQLSAETVSTPVKTGAASNPYDVLDLSPDAHEALKTIQKGIDELRQLDIKFSAMRLNAVKERIALTSKLISNANPENVDGFYEEVRALGREIASAGRQIGFTVGDPAFQNKKPTALTFEGISGVKDREQYREDYTALVKGFQTAVGGFNKLASIFA